MVRRFLDGRVRPQTLVLMYFFGLLASAGATLLLLGALFLRYLPHGYLLRAGLACSMDDGCGTTLPVWAGAGFSFLIAGVALGLALFAAYAVCGQLSCSSRRCRDVLAGAVRYPGRVPATLRGRVLLIPDAQPVSYIVGFLKPRVVVSRGLLDTLEDEELLAVLAHEEGHALRQDNLVALFAQTLAMTFAVVPGVRRCFTSLRRSQELAADEHARERTGDGLVVAASLHKFARSLTQPRPSALAAAGMGFADEGDVGERIRGLLKDELMVTSRRRLAVVLATLMFLFAGFTGSALAFTQVTFAGTSACAACHQEAPAANSSLTAHGSCASEI